MSTETIKTDREFALAPGQYTYTQDTSKGTINTYVGPNVVQPSGQERPVTFNARSRRFGESELRASVQTNVFASRGEYIVLSNPSAKSPNDHPQSGKTSAVDLLYGERVNIQGPANFALWPGQFADTIPGHQLRSNEYLLIKIIDAATARENWSTAAVEATAPSPTPSTNSDSEGEDGESDALTIVASNNAPEDLTAGRLYVVKGTDVSFYMPPTGVEVVADENGDFVRSALTLERLEYAVLVDESGDKRFPKGPDVVFPSPTEEFVTDSKGKRAFRAIELNPIQGIHVKVTAAYVDNNGVKRNEGDELWITGTETPIYYPRHEHFLIEYDGKAKSFAVAVPEGQARYVLDRGNARVKTVKGPAMLLPDPRTEVIVRRALTGTECRLWYPGNDEVKKYNSILRQQAAATPTTRKGFVSEGQAARSKKLRADQKSWATGSVMYGDAAVAGKSLTGSAKGGPAGGEFSRGSTFIEPRTVTLNGRLQGVPTINLWTNYAVLVTSASGKKRRVEVGPTSLFLDFDESLESFTVSTGKPKNTDALLTDVYLRVRNNKVSDIITATTADRVDVTMKLSLVCNFGGDDPQKWFAVENYVKFVTDHVRSVVRGTIRGMTIAQFSESSENIIRDTILGTKAEDADGNVTPRPGMVFADNALTVDDVDVLDVTIGDYEIAQQLKEAQHGAVTDQIAIQRARAMADSEKELETIKREKQKLRDDTAKLAAKLELDAARRIRDAAALRAEHELAAEAERLDIVERVEAVAEFQAVQKLQRKVRTDQQYVAHEFAKQGVKLSEISAETEATKARLAAVQPGFSEAILALRDERIAVDIAEATSVQRLIGGKSLTDVIGKVFSGTPLGDVVNSAFGRVGRDRSDDAPTSRRSPSL